MVCRSYFMVTLVEFADRRKCEHISFDRGIKDIWAFAGVGKEVLCVGTWFLPLRRGANRSFSKREVSRSPKLWYLY